MWAYAHGFRKRPGCALIGTFAHGLHMSYTCLIVLDPEIPFTLPEMKGISGTDGANYNVIK